MRSLLIDEKKEICIGFLGLVKCLAVISKFRQSIGILKISAILITKMILRHW